MVYHGRFVWYELMTTDMAAAKAFYASVVGWDAQDASVSDYAYALFTAASAPLGGLMELPQEARKMGATPRWMGYVGVDDLEAATGRIGRVGWHELFAPDWQKVFAFYGEIFGWRKGDAEIGSSEIYQLFSAGGPTI